MRQCAATVIPPKVSDRLGPMIPGGPLADLDLTSVWGAIETAADLAGLAIYLVRLDPGPARVIYVSPRAAQITGRPRSELVGSAPWSMLRAADWPMIQGLIARAPSELPSAFEASIERPDGTLVPIEITATRLDSRGGSYGFGYFRDVTTQRETVAALAASEARFRFLVESAPDGVVILVRGAIAFMNPKAAQLLGAGAPEAAVGKQIAQFLPPRDAALTLARLHDQMRTGQEAPPREYGTLADPSRVVEIKSVPCQWEGQPAVIAFARDVTERKAIEHRLIEADRLAALGTLAAGVAHEINNPLTYAQLSTQRIERALASSEVSPALAAVIREHLRDIDHGITRIASITQGLRSFARADDNAPGPVDLAAVIEQSLKMVDNDLRHRAQLIRRLSDVPAVTGNASRLEQVIVNVLINALQALPTEGPQTILVALPPAIGDQVTLEITDSGRGIPAAIRDKVFDPFFTTRQIGQGMGLGLAVCKTIVESFGGTISIESTEGVGTRVSITLARHPTRIVDKEAAPPEPPPSVRRTLLIIDDEPLVRNALARLLATDHEVHVASSGAEGLAAILATRFDVIFCDVMMPGMNGREVHDQVAVLRPGTERRIVFISGGTFNPEVDEFLATSTNPRLGKPFKVEDILASIDGAAAGSSDRSHTGA